MLLVIIVTIIIIIIKKIEKLKKKNENYTISTPKENLHCHGKSRAKGPRFKISSEGLSAEINILQRSPIQVQTKVEVY